MTTPETDTDTGTEKPADISAEQAADLAALEASVAGPAAPVVAHQVQDQGPQPPSAQAMGVAVMAMGALRPLLCHLVKGLDTAPDELWVPVTESTAGLLDHYGLARPELQGPWAKLGMSIVPLAGMVALSRMQNPEPEEQKSDVYQVPGVPAPSAAEIERAAQAEPEVVGFHQ